MLRSLRHRNIVQFYGACLEPDCFFIVTELMHGAGMGHHHVVSRLALAPSSGYPGPCLIAQTDPLPDSTYCHDGAAYVTRDCCN